MAGMAEAQPTLTVSPSMVKPGETISISGQNTPSITIKIEISNSRAHIDSFNVTTDSYGEYSVKYQLRLDSPIDIYSVHVDASSEASFIVSRMTQKQLANTLRKIVENAKHQAESAIIQARKKGFSIPPEIMEKYTQGLGSIAEAGRNIHNQNYFEANESLQEALNMFREIIDYSYEKDIAPPINPEQEHLRVQEIINQLKRQYNEINTVTKRLKQHGVSVEVLEQELNTLNNRIIQAQELLNEGKIIEAHNIATRTQQLVKQRFITLRQKQTEITKKLAQRYQLSLENRVTTFIDTFQKLQTIRPVQSELALKELKNLQELLNQSQTFLESGNIPNALREMHRTEYRLSNLSETVNGAVTSRLMNRLEELTANLQEATGIEANEIEEEIDKTKDSLSDYLQDKPITSSQNNSSLTP